MAEISKPEGVPAAHMLQDIRSEPAVVAETIAEGAASLPRLAARLKELRFGAAYTVGCGSSYFAALAGRYALEEHATLPTLPLSAKDFELYSLEAAPLAALVVAISQSGETLETLVAARAAKQRGLPVVALTNNTESSLARLCDGIVRTWAGEEEGPGTKTVLAQCVAIYQFALYLAQAFRVDKSRSIDDAVGELRAAPDLVRTMLSGHVEAKVEELASRLAAEQALYLVGAGPFSALALQAANLLREAGKLHCYAFEATEFRHGPLEVLSSRSCLLVLSSSRCRAREQVVRACDAARKVGVRLFYAGDAAGRPDVEFDTELMLPTASELLAAQLYLAPLQLLAFHLAKKRGLDPDRFTNIVKTWTS